jgi:hypothetical protein
VSPLPPTLRLAWPRAMEPLEGRIATLYLDTDEPPVMTTGAGYACNSLQAVLAIPWRRGADDAHDGGMATTSEIASEYARVRAEPGGLVWTHYAAGATIHLAPADLDALTLARLDDFARTLAALFPSFPGWPWQAMAGALSIAWAVGVGATSHGVTGPEWPHWQAACREQDWRAAAKEGVIRWEGNAGVKPRDMLNRALFLLAAGESVNAARAAAGIPDAPATGDVTGGAAARALAALLGVTGDLAA